MVNVTRLSRADFPAEGASQKRFHGALFSLAVSPLSHSRHPAFTCVVSKAVASKATKRNVIRRRCREAVRARLRTFTGETPFALIFRAKKAASKASPADLQRDIGALVDKILNTGYNTRQ